MFSDTSKIRIFQKGWNFNQDGPGNRLLYHLQGCNLKCPWCSNPEGISMAGTLLVSKHKLQDSICPFGAIKNQILDRLLCENCISKVCITKNRNEGIKLSYTEYSINDIYDEVLQSKSLFYNGGGVTFTGGEPTLQFNELKNLAAMLDKEGINIALETNGTHPFLSELFAFLDTLMIDFKHWDNNKHRQILGLGNEMIVENIKKASGSGTTIWIRIPLVPHFNDSEIDIMHFIEIIKPLNNNHLFVEILPYHEYGKVKWELSGLDYTMKNEYVSVERILKIEKVFRENDLKIINNLRKLI
ncbi:glycyl-radical enzyme activating protein [Sunxiuqinia sp. A32]|uniref:glycyl-radical enzyme activating protein n=1 Tax=Sunxiuqinia sp. A32 TaxID=3461496 RepID=UPI004045656F